MDIQIMIDKYTDWLNSEFSATKIGGFWEITTPYLDSYNDCLQIYVRQNEDGSYFLTDDGYIIRNLQSSGILSQRSKKKKEMLSQITRSLGVSVNGNSLEIQATKSDFPRKQHRLIQAMLAVDHMFFV